MKQKITYFLLCILCCAGTFTSCSDVPDAAALAPKDAAVVVVMDVKDFLEKSDLGHNEDLQSMMDKALDKEDVSSKATKKIKEYIEDPMSMGFDLSKALVFFAADKSVFENEAALLGCVDDEDNLKEFMNMIAYENDLDKVKESKYDLYYFRDGRSLLVFNDDYFLFTEISWDQYSDNGYDAEEATPEALKAISKLFELEKDRSVAENEAFTELCSRDGFVKLFVSGAGLNEIENVQREFEPLEKMDINLADYALLASLNAEDGEATLEAEVMGLNEKAQAKLAEQMYLKPIKGTFLNYMDQNAILSAVVGFDGQKVWNVIEEIGKKQGKSFNEDTDMIKQLLNSMQGDMAYQFTNFKDEYNMEMTAYVSSDNADLVHTLQPLTGAQSVGENKYCIPSVFGSRYSTSYYEPYDSVAVDYDEYDSYGDYDSYSEYNAYSAETSDNSSSDLMFGWKDKANYFITGKNPVAFKKPSSPVDEENYKNRMVYVRFNPNALLKADCFEEMRGKEEFSMAKKFCEPIDCVELYVENEHPGKVTLRLVMTEKDTNPLKLIMEKSISILKKKIR